MEKLIFLFVLVLLFELVTAKEGMWIPTLLKKYNIEEMQQMGFKLTAEDIYDVNNASMKDAVVLFGGGCTGELISGDGLLITNHHCGYSQIQSHSSIEHDYLTDGFWAKNKGEELPNPGLSVQFLLNMEDVTDKIMVGVDENMDDETRNKIITKNIESVRATYSSGENYKADVKPLFYGNQYFVYVYEVFQDVRLVGAPPSAIGKFGGDTDNWMWPRHTGDFSLFRIYAGKDNKPAAYSPENVPYKSKKHFQISMKGINEGDFTMVFGFPGSTQRYLPSEAVKLIMEQSDPNKVAVRTAKLDILASQMEADPKVRIQYSSKYVSAANAWKKWQGEVKGLKRLDAIEVKQEEESKFISWVNADSERVHKYGHILTDFERLYKEIEPYQVVNDYYQEIIQRGTDVANLISAFELAEKVVGDSAKFNLLIKGLNNSVHGFLKNYDPETDGKVFVALMKIYKEKVDPKYLPKDFIAMKSHLEIDEFLSVYYSKSLFTDSVRLKTLLDDFNAKSVKRIKKDPLYSLFVELKNYYNQNIDPVFKELSNDIQKVQKEYMLALMEMNQNERMIADANLTLRVAYGKIEGYEPADGIKYDYSTTLRGIMEKDNPKIYDYNVPETLRKLYHDRDFGSYSNQTGEVPVAFCASNHTTGGNSGSPVLNAEGQLIGVNFDRCWEGTMSDIMFDPELCRNIALDIRYALFIIDKFAGAGYLLDEMDIVR
jgi:hypothetical protein